MAKMTFKSPESKAKIATILALLRAVPLNSHDLAEMIPLSRRWTTEYLGHLHSAGRVYILRWDKDIANRKKRHAMPVYAPGRGADAPRPAPDAPTVRYKRAWRSTKSDPERHMHVLARRRVRHRMKDLRPDPAAAWIRPVLTEIENKC